MRVATAPGSVSIVVSDRGAGIPPNELDRIFDRFYRVAGARRSRARAPTIAATLARLHGRDDYGRFRNRGKGTAFTVSLPDCAAEAQ